MVLAVARMPGENGTWTAVNNGKYGGDSSNVIVVFDAECLESGFLSGISEAFDLASKMKGCFSNESK
jgi:hypothetical protein